ncbi:hypothetical protein RISK_000984 [Rhodopirellula islandica]|uniref:Uncharacterized protein n=1 Tax=Rhodopirellula islandica TaxID=595434 RepID=A0A0J1BL74_RHOIS|nr:hypothetical protein RISK_000984 [Rhodopirellula islandica]
MAIQGENETLDEFRYEWLSRLGDGDGFSADWGSFSWEVQRSRGMLARMIPRDARGP